MTALRGRWYRVASVDVRTGDTVARGHAAVVMEAMKMELAVPAPRDGVVASVTAAPGGPVEEGALFLAEQGRPRGRLARASLV